MKRQFQEFLQFHEEDYARKVDIWPDLLEAPPSQLSLYVRGLLALSHRQLVKSV